MKQTGEIYIMYLDEKNQYCENDYIIQSNLKIQCNPYQNTNDIFHKSQNKNVCNLYGSKRPPIAKAVLSTELEEAGSLTSNSSTKLQ